MYNQLDILYSKTTVEEIKTNSKDQFTIFFLHLANLFITLIVFRLMIP